MKKQYLNPEAVFEPRFFTHTVAVTGPTKLVYVSGQVSYDRDGKVVGKGDMAAQTHQVFRSIAANLEAAGATWHDVVKLNGYMVNLNPDALRAYRETRERFLDAAALPASTLVGVERLVHDDLLLEVEAVAAVAVVAAKRRTTRAAAKKPAKRKQR
jgi:enamine deaminase RidA (YjgF/YER057c/UK114 family)